MSTREDCPELGAADGMPPPDGSPSGECILTWLADGRLRVDRADPRVLISAELVDHVMVGYHPDVALDWTGPVQLGPVGALLKIRTVNRQVVYRLTEWIPSARAYVGEWPE